MTKICHIISNLNAGGAETMLLRLLQATDQTQYPSTVISLSDIGPIGQEIAQAGITVKSLGMKHVLFGPLALIPLVRMLRQVQPDVIHTWMYHADLFGGLAARFVGKPPVVWAVHHATLNPETTRRTTIFIANICARLSSWLPSRIVYCSSTSQKNHTKMGYNAEIATLIPNGFDLTALSPNPKNRAAVRSELGLTQTTPLAGLIARFHPDKDHQTFCTAAGLLLKEIPEARFLLCGNEISADKEPLMEMIREAGIQEACHLLGRRDDVARLLGALDIAVCSSRSEAFPLVLGEAMASGVPCVATDVGDNSIIIDNTGSIVPPASPAELARAMADMLNLPPSSRQSLGEKARSRIAENYALHQTAKTYQDLYDALST